MGDAGISTHTHPVSSSMALSERHRRSQVKNLVLSHSLIFCRTFIFMHPRGFEYKIWVITTDFTGPWAQNELLFKKDFCVTTDFLTVREHHGYFLLSVLSRPWFSAHWVERMRESDDYYFFLALKFYSVVNLHDSGLYFGFAGCFFMTD